MGVEGWAVSGFGVVVGLVADVCAGGRAETVALWLLVRPRALGAVAGCEVELAGPGVIEVRYRGAERSLPDANELHNLWRNQYFIDSLKGYNLV